MIVLRFFFIAALVKLLLVTDRPMLCAGLYTTLVALLGLFGLTLGFGSILWFLLFIVVRFGLSLLYFSLLSRFEGTGLWWVILIMGLFLGVV